MLAYADLTLRNSGYVSDETQAKIRGCRLLIAGCGIGSSFAEAAVRLGFENLTLVDGDTVAAHNINRQDFTVEDIGKAKVRSLGKRLRAINPMLNVQEIDGNIDRTNVAEIVAEADMVFDTIDFLDLGAIVALHDECRRQEKPAITAWGIGWGAACIYFPIGGTWSFRRLFGLPEDGAVEDQCYASVFSPLVERLQAYLDPAVVAVTRKALTVMRDGTPCPASQVSPGAFAVGALGCTVAARILAGLAVPPAPRLILVDMPTALISGGIDLSV